MTSNKPGFLDDINEAVELIKSDTRENPVVDIDYMMAHMKWIEVGGNFRIPKIRKLNQSEQKTDKLGRTKVIEHIGSVYVEISNSFDKELLKKTLNDKYYEMTHKEYQELKTRGISTVADDAEGENAVRPRPRSTMAKEGETLGGGEMVTNGEGLSV